MSIGYTLKPEKKLALAVWDGTVTWNQWDTHLHRMFPAPEYAPIQFQITDMRFASVDSSITDNEIQQAFDFMATYRDKISLKKVAIIAGDEWVRARLAERLLAALSVNAILFNELRTGCLWLGLDTAEMENEVQKLRRRLQENS